MKKFKYFGLLIILSFSILSLLYLCNHSDNVKISNDENLTLKEQIQNPQTITDSVYSDFLGGKVVIQYMPSQKNDYIAEHQSGVELNSKYAKERNVDKGQIHFPCKNETISDYKISKEKILNIVSVLEGTYDDRADYIFTTDTIFEVEVSSGNAGIFTDSYIKYITNQINFSSKPKYQKNNNKNCDFNNNYFNLVLDFCQKNKIKIN